MRQGKEILQSVPQADNDGLGQNRPSPQPFTPASKKSGAMPHKQEAHSDQDLEFDCDTQSYPLIPEGKYEVAFLRAEKKWLWGGQKVFLHFQIVESGEFQGEELYMACNAPKKSKRGKVPTSCKYYQAWVLAAGRRPDRYDRMSTNVFRGKVFLAKVRTPPNNAKNVARLPLLQHSIIDDLLERLTNNEKK
jgi:hypothetical protein